ncbi:MAG: sigma-70 family RNA polymerase sigma factor, partial [Planctomycetes bacterium]|nr:sigma-70 family RNA polymerase sigma factor [Planctomycetota bacterium]
MSAPHQVEHTFRHSYGRLVASLTRVFGPGRIDLVEDVVQDAMLKAMRSWPFSGVPRDPEAWLARVARNLALDALRRDKVRDAHATAFAVTELDRTSDPASADRPAVTDDSLRMIFTCCHPSMPPESRVALTLKTLCGFGTREIASALLTKESTIAQRLTRAKAKLQRDGVRFEVPPADCLDERLESVLEVIYLVFNEGYRAHRGVDLVRLELVSEAVRLAQLLIELETIDQPRVHALLSLMLFLGARIPARANEAGELLTLAEQDRTKWNAEWTRAAFDHFEKAIGGTRLSSYHVEASIASLHAMAPSYDATDWKRILDRYDQLVTLTDSPVVRLNRCVAVAKARGIDVALRELEVLGSSPELADYLLMPVTVAHLCWWSGDRQRAVAEYRRALEMQAT